MASSPIIKRELGSKNKNLRLKFVLKATVAFCLFNTTSMQAFAQSACSMVEFNSVYSEVVGTVDRTDNLNVLNHHYRSSGAIPDGWYPVDTSTGTGGGLSDTPTLGLTCTGTDAVILTGDDIPTGSFSIADLAGGGITLGTLADGQSTTLTYSCEVN